MHIGLACVPGAIGGWFAVATVGADVGADAVVIVVNHIAISLSDREIRAADSLQ